VGRKGLSIYQKMQTDDAVKAALAMKKHAILSTGWDIEPVDDKSDSVEVAEFVKWNFTKMDGCLDQNLQEMLCLHGDTIIHSPDGDRPIRELVGTTPLVYSYVNGRMTLARASKVWLSKQNAPCIRVTYRWRTGNRKWGFVWKEDSIICTDNHPFLLRNGSYKRAGLLRSGDRLMPFDQQRSKDGYVRIKPPHERQCKRANWVYTEVCGPVPEGSAVHHRNEEKADDAPENLEIKGHGRHISEHTRNRLSKMTEQELQNHVKAMLKAKAEGLAAGADWVRRAREKQIETMALPNQRARLSRQSRALWGDAKIVDRMRSGFKAAWTPERKAKLADANRKRIWTDDMRRKKGRSQRLAMLAYHEKQRAVQTQGDNHEVISIEPWGFADVYDMHVPEVQNFVANSVFLHNCSLAYGFSVSELLYRQLDSGPYNGKLGLKSIKSRLPHGFLFVTDGHDNLLPDGIEQWGKRLPTEKFALMSYMGEHQNQYGTSDLRAAYRAWWLKTNAWTWLGMFLDRYCYSDDTEILTEQGWRNISEPKVGDKVATLSPDTGEMEYRSVTDTFADHYRGKMLHQGGRYIDLLVTPNHRMWVSTETNLRDRPDYRFRFIEAKDLPRSVAYKRDAIWHGVEQEYFTLPALTVKYQTSNHLGLTKGVRTLDYPERTMPMDDWLRFFGVWLAEGCAYETPGGSKRVLIGQKNGPDADRIASWISAAGLHAQDSLDKHGMRTFTIKDRQLFEYLLQFGKAGDKFVPIELKQISQRQLRILLDALWLGDGSDQGYCTKSERLADDVQEIILKCGWAGVKKRNTTCPDGSPLYAVSRNEARIGASFCNRPDDRRSWMDYSGMIYCVTVPPHHLVYVRRNGKACWSGNSVPLAEGIVPSSGMVPEGTVDDVRTSLENLQAATSYVHPDFITLQFPTSGISAQGSSVFERTFALCDMAIARSLLLPNLLGLSAQGDTGSYGQAKKHFDVFILIIEKLQRDLAETVMGEQVIRRLVDLNYQVEDYPKFVFLPFTESDKANLLTLWLQAIAAGGVTSTPEDEAHIRLITEFPEKSAEDIEAAKVEQTGAGQVGVMAPTEDGTAIPQDNELDAVIVEAMKKSYDFDPNQARDQDGKWTAGGSAGGGDKKETKSRPYRIPKEWQEQTQIAPNIPPGRQGQCQDNSARTNRQKGFRTVIGAIWEKQSSGSFIADRTFHAWNLDKADRIVDTTLGSIGAREYRYFGEVVPNSIGRNGTKIDEYGWKRWPQRS
jgi:hypothetical protein